MLTVDAELRLYGSSVNGFGSSSSDMDISMVLGGQESMDVSVAMFILKFVGSSLLIVVNRQLPNDMIQSLV